MAGLIIGEGLVQKRKSPDFGSPEAGIAVFCEMIL